MLNNIESLEDVAFKDIVIFFVEQIKEEIFITSSKLSKAFLEQELNKTGGDQDYNKFKHSLSIRIGRIITKTNELGFLEEWKKRCFKKKKSSKVLTIEMLLAQFPYFNEAYQKEKRKTYSKEYYEKNHEKMKTYHRNYQRRKQYYKKKKSLGAGDDIILKN